MQRSSVKQRVTRGGRCLFSLLVVVTVVTSLTPFAGRAVAANGNANLYLGKTVSAATLAPALSLTLGVDRSSAIPGDTLTYTATLANTGGVISLAGDLTAYNQSGVTGQIAAYWDAFFTSTNDPCSSVSTQGNNASGWTALAGTAFKQAGYTLVDPTPLATGLQLAVYPVTSSGVTYPTNGDLILGTRIAAGATGHWHYTAAISVSPAQEAFLLDRTKVTEERNTFHTEITPRVQTGSGQPNTVNTVFCDLVKPGVSGTVSNASVALSPPQGDRTVTFDASTTAGLVSLVPGGAVTVTYPWRVHVPNPKGPGESDAAYTARLQALEGARLLATATASGTAYGGAVSAGPAMAATTEHVPVLSIAKGGPATAAAGSTASYPVNLANAGGATALSVSVTDSVPSGGSATVTGTPTALAPGATGSATAMYPVPIAQPCGPLADTAAVTWQDGNANTYGPVSSSYTTTVTACFAGSSLTLAPTMAGPDVTGTSQVLKATFLNSAGLPISGQAVSFSVTGANVRSGTATTDPNGVASFSYVGSNHGTDLAQASFASGSFAIQSNTATINWVTPIATVSTTTVHGVFFAGGCGSFCHAPGSTAAFAQDFPTIDFNPPGGTIPGNNTGVTVDTRPFTDITTDVGGNFSGSVVAQGGGVQAGIGSLFTFDAVFTAEYVVSQPGNVTFNFYSDDGFIFGVGGGATRVSGPMVNAPSTTPFQGYPVIGAYNQPTSPVANSITVNFPAAGTYPYEADYSECCGGQVAFTMASSLTGHGVPPAGNLTLTPQSTPTQSVGQAVTLMANAMDASGQPVGNLPLTLTVTGPNSQQLSGTTNAQGLATFTYIGSAAGTDQDEVGGSLSGLPAISNIAVVPWAFSVSGQSSGTSTAPPPSITAVSPADGALVTAPTAITATVAPPAGETIASWSVTATAASTGVVLNVASGTGTPPTPLATFDPSLLSDDSYTVTVTVTASGGGVQSTTTTVDVGGHLKPGRFVSTFQDLTVPVNGVPMAVQRIYDSYDRSAGDFGSGWRIQLGDFTVSSNRLLGAGGWIEYTSSCFILCSYAFRSTVAHYVTVTFPDRHQEVFDFTPAGPSLTLVDFAQGTAAFTPRAGNTSSLAVTDPSNQGFSNGFDGNLYDSSGRPYNPTRFTLTAKDGHVYVLDTGLGLVSESDASGNTVNVDSSGVHLTLGPASQPTPGPSITISRDPAHGNRVTEVAGPNDGVNGQNQHLLYTYDTAGRLSSVTDPEGHVSSYSYDPATGLLTNASDPDGPIQTVTYGSDGRVASIANGGGPAATVTTAPGAEQQVILDPNGRLSTVLTFDSLGDVLERDQAVNGQTLVTKYAYDTAGRLTDLVDPSGAHPRWTYDETSTASNGNILSYSDASGHTWQFGNSDQHGNAGTILSPDGTPYLAYTYYPSGLVHTAQRAGQPAATYTYYADGLLQTSTDPAGRALAYTYNGAGFITSQSDNAGHTTYYTPDNAGNPVAVKDPSGNTTTYSYDGSGALTGETDGADVQYTFQYDSRGHVMSASDPAGTTSYAYNSLGLVQQRTDSNQAVTTYVYDADGNLTQETRPSNDVLNYRYDGLERLTEADDASGELNFAYDMSGNKVAQTSCAPQAQGAPCPGSNATASQPTVPLTYTYFANGDEQSVNGPNLVATYGYDANDLLHTVTDTSGRTFTYSPNAASQVSTLASPNGVTQSYGYDAGGLPTSALASVGSTQVAGGTYTLDPVTAQRTALSSQDGVATFSYQANGWLSGETQPGATALPSGTYSYDGAGNRTAWNGLSPSAVIYDAAGRLVQAGTLSYVYDNEGDLRTKTDSSTGAVTTYQWNADHELVQVTFPDSSTSQYQYDPLGRRISVNDNGQVTRYAFDGANVVAEFDSNNNETASYTLTPAAIGAASTQTPARPLEVTRGAAATYYVTDTNGSTIATTDGSGAVTARYHYGASGNAPTTNGPETTYTFEGASLDRATGLYHMGDRYYDPATGRFISRDPASSQYIRAPLGNQTRDAYLSFPWMPGTEQRYVFAANDPIDLSDPGGDGFVADIPRAIGAIGCAIVVALSGGAPLVLSQAGVTAVQVCVDDIDALAETSENRGSVTRLLINIGEHPDFARLAIAVDDAEVTGKFLAQAEDVLQLEIDLQG